MTNTADDQHCCCPIKMGRRRTTSFCLGTYGFTARATSKADPTGETEKRRVRSERKNTTILGVETLECVGVGVGVGWGWWREKNLSCRVCDKGVRRKTFPVLGQSSPFVDVPVYYHFVICHQRRQGGHALGERREAGEDVQGQDRRAVVQDHVRQCRVSRNGATNEQAFVCYTTSSITGNGSGRSAWKQLVGYSC